MRELRTRELRRGAAMDDFSGRSGRSSVARLIPAGLAALIFGMVCGTARANTITVYSLVDPGAADTCALRDAITAANTKKAVNACAKGSGTDTIVFNTGLSGTISLNSSLPAIVNTLTIQGTATNPPAITINGQNSYQILMVNSGAILNLSYLTIENGLAGNPPLAGGGAVDNNGTLNVDDCAFSGNKAIAASLLGITEGGAILNEGTLAVGNSTFTANQASLGGAIYTGGTASGTASVINSTLASNKAFQNGGGVYLAAGKMNVVSSTFADNLVLLSSGEGGSIYNDSGKAKVKESIWASPSGGNCGGDLADINDQDYNLYDDITTSCIISSPHSAYVSDADLDLGTLANNGGPTQTIALGTDSTAVDYIPAGACKYIDVNPCVSPLATGLGSAGALVCDQRGVVRPQAAKCDAGAYELQGTSDFENFSTGLIVFPLQFSAGGSFTLPGGASFGSINPTNQPVTITVSSPATAAVPTFGPLGVTIPPGSFVASGGGYKYSGTIGGVKYGVSISAPVDGVYNFTFAVFGVSVTGITNPVSVTLQIGPYIGTDDVDAAIL
jgi:hypothetical protein